MLMNARVIVGLLVGWQLLAAGPGFSQSDSPPGGGTILGGILRGLAEALTQRHGGPSQPGRPGHSHHRDGPRVFNVVDPRTGDDSRIFQGQVFQIVGDGFGRREGQVALLPEGASEWYMVRTRGIQEWRDDSVTVVIAESPFPGRQTRIAVGIVTAEGHSDALRDVTFYATKPGSYGPGGLPPILPNGPGRDDPYEVPASITWSLACLPGNPDESPSNTKAARTLNSMGPAPVPGPGGAFTRYWSGGTVGLFTLGAPSTPPWFHFVASVAAGTPNAARLARNAAEAGVLGDPVRPGAGLTPPGGFPAVVVSTEKLSRDQQVMPSTHDRAEDEQDARLLREALRLTVPPSVGRLRLQSVEELARQDWGRGARSVVKSLAGEGRNMNVVAFLVNTHERARDGWRTVRSLKVAIIANGTHSSDSCHRLLSAP